MANDAAPSRAFMKLEPVLRARGLNVELIVNDGKPNERTDEEVCLALSDANVVVLGMSSSEQLAHIEILAGETAQKLGIPYGFYGDVPRCFARARAGAWFEHLAKDVSFYCGVNIKDAEEAQKVFTNPHTHLIAIGNPLREEMAFPRLTRKQAREQLNILPDKKLVLASGTKLTASDLASWVLIMDALCLLPQERSSWHLILTTHPSDRTLYAVDGEVFGNELLKYVDDNFGKLDMNKLREYTNELIEQNNLNLYDEMVSLSPIPTRLVSKDFMTASDILPGADIVIGHGSIAVEAAYQNIPVISLGAEVMMSYFTQVDGFRELETVEDGISEFVGTNAKDLAVAIDRLLVAEGFAQMKERQNLIYQKPDKRGQALENIADVIEVQVCRDKK